MTKPNSNSSTKEQLENAFVKHDCDSWPCAGCHNTRKNLEELLKQEYQRGQDDELKRVLELTKQVEAGRKFDKQGHKDGQ